MSGPEPGWEQRPGGAANAYTRPLIGSELWYDQSTRLQDGLSQFALGVQFTTTIHERDIEARVKAALVRLRFECPLVAATIERGTHHPEFRSWVYAPLPSAAAARARADQTVHYLRTPADPFSFLRAAVETTLPHVLADGSEQFLRVYLTRPSAALNAYCLAFHTVHSIADAKLALNALSLLLEWTAAPEAGVGDGEDLAWGTEQKNLPLGPVTAKLCMHTVYHIPFHPSTLPPNAIFTLNLLRQRLAHRPPPAPHGPPQAPRLLPRLHALPHRLRAAPSRRAPGPPPRRAPAGGDARSASEGAVRLAAREPVPPAPLRRARAAHRSYQGGAGGHGQGYLNVRADGVTNVGRVENYVAPVWPLCHSGSGSGRSGSGKAVIRVDEMHLAVRWCSPTVHAWSVQGRLSVLLQAADMWDKDVLEDFMSIIVEQISFVVAE